MFRHVDQREVKMADIYKSRRISPQYQSSFRASQVRYDDKSKELQQMAAKEKAEADDIYSLSISNTATMNMNELYTQYENDPKALSEGLKKLGSKIADEIPTDEMKVKFLSNYMLNSQSLVNKAQANFERIQEKNRQSAIFDNIQNNIKNMELSFSNGLNGKGSANDLANYQESVKRNKSLLNSRNKDGTYMFSDAQRLALSNEIDKTSINAFTNSMAEMSDSDRRNLIERLNKDEVVLIDSEGKQINLKDSVDETVYKDMKRASLIADNKLKKQAIQEWNLNKKYSEIQMQKEPNAQNYAIWESYHNDASEDQKQQMQEMANYIPNEDAITSFESTKEAFDSIKNLSKLPIDTDEEQKAFGEELTNVLSKTMKTNKEGNLASDDVTEIQQALTNMLADKDFKRQIAKLPDVDFIPSEPTDIIRKEDAMRFAPLGIINAANKGLRLWQQRDNIQKIAQTTMSDLLKLNTGSLSAQDIDRINQDIDGDITTYSKPEAAQIIYENGVINAMREKYYWEDSLKQKLVKGKTKVNINGKPYTYMGIDKDIILERSESW